jgi:hypothetical protein
MKGRLWRNSRRPLAAVGNLAAELRIERHRQLIMAPSRFRREVEKEPIGHSASRVAWMYCPAQILDKMALLRRGRANGIDGQSL